MAELEKVIKGLEICIRVQDNEKCPDECPYRKDICYGTVGLMADALSLLKAQEPFEPVELINDFYPIGDPLRTIGWRCGKCGERIAGYDNYCPNCGKAVKWE